ncbi:MAG: prepilin-type N-terminal cleavage/methylation domain-containing protein [Phycisphaerae bacterium]|jgi:prepilin-type processing-associated H-X9-DG protein/prepilin-type N-terminal cleavage/methylation domain-containing protein
MTRNRTVNTVRGFTLVELLVVISIIAMLLAVLMPAMKKARQQAQKVVCSSNMRQMGVALQCYLQDSDTRLPDSSCHHLDDPNQYWLKILSKYLKQDLLFKCPSDTARDFIDWDKPLESQGDKRWSSFALNALLDSKCDRPDKYNKGKYNRTRMIPKPQYCIYVSESLSSWTAVDHIHPEQWFYNIKLAKGQIAWDRHSKKSNYLFADGHAEMLKFEDTYSWPGNCLWFPECAPAWPNDE